jgi:farnesyl-diphosphate farnesyltransferase
MPPAPSIADESFQTRILQGVSRTFALTIPTLPGGLDRAVANAYLLCRIADTIEDDAGLTLDAKRAYSEQFIAIVEGRAAADSFARELAPRLAAHASAAERELIAGSAAVVRITHSLNDPQRAALARCVRVMAEGMVFYQGQETLDGLSDQAAMDRYCYFVAGVVGEMLTALFCDFCHALGEREAELMQLAVSFGQGLQMTNILKDVWEDRARGACWLPRDLFAARGITLSTLAPGRGGAAFADGLAQLVAIAHGHLRNALRYTLLIPSSEPGIRRFCLWALGMAVLTLRKLHGERDFAHGAAVKISRRTVKITVATTSAAVRSDRLLQCLFGLAARGLPQQRIATPIASVAGIAGGRAAFEPHTKPH